MDLYFSHIIITLEVYVLFDRWGEDWFFDEIILIDQDIYLLKISC